MPQFDTLLAGIWKFLDVPALHDLPSILPKWQGWGHWPEWPELEFVNQWVLNLGFHTKYPVVFLLVPIILWMWSRSQPAVGHSRLPNRRRRWYKPLLNVATFMIVLGLIGGGIAGSFIATGNLIFLGFLNDNQAFSLQYLMQPRFQHSLVLGGLSIILLLGGLYWANRSSQVMNKLMYATFAGFLACLIVAAAQPKKWDTAPGASITARDIFFGIDITTNVKEATSTASITISEDNKAIAQGVHPEHGCGTIEQWGLRKLDAQAYTACKIAEALPGDRIAIATFDGSTYCCTPEYTHDHKFVFRQLQLVNQHIGDSNTNFDGGGNASIQEPGFFQKALDYIEKNSKSATKVLILWTDGDGTIQEDRLQEFAKRMEKMGIITIFLGAGPDTVAYDPESDTLVKLGRDPRVNALITDPVIPENLQKVIDLIKSHAPSEIKLDDRKVERPIHEPFILLALILFVCFRLCSARMARIR